MERQTEGLALTVDVSALADGGADSIDGAHATKGGTGNGIYIVDDLEDSITEAAEEGLDTLHADVTGYVLAEGVSVETLVADGGRPGRQRSRQSHPRRRCRQHPLRP